jgi:hypothetical protein
MSLCKYEGCLTPLTSNSIRSAIAKEYDLCLGCYSKICRFEKALDSWLDREYPFLYLEDVFSWYVVCINNPCQRDCLEPANPEIVGCYCCPHLQNLQYNRHRIDNMLMPTKEWIENLDR